MKSAAMSPGEAPPAILSAIVENAPIQAFRHPLVAPRGEGFRGGFVADPELCGGQGSRLRQTRFRTPIDTFDPEARYDQTLDGDYAFAGMTYHHFGHVMSELVHRILLSRDAVRDGASWLFVHALGQHTKLQEMPRYITDIYRFLGIDPARAIVVNEHSVARRLFVSEQGSDIGGGAKPGYLALIEQHSRGRLDEAFGNTPRPGKVYVARTEVTGGFLGERYVEKVFERAGFYVMRPQNLPFMEQSDIYRKAEVVIFPEGSAVHGTELLWEGAIKRAILVNRHGHEFPSFEVVLRPRSRRLHSFRANRYVASLGFLRPGAADGHPNVGVAYFDLEAMAALLKAEGIAKLEAIDQRAYREAVERDVALYVQRWKKEQQVPDERVAEFMAATDRAFQALTK